VKKDNYNLTYNDFLLLLIKKTDTVWRLSLEKWLLTRHGKSDIRELYATQKKRNITAFIK
jgi:hypothetical protein